MFPRVEPHPGRENLPESPQRTNPPSRRQRRFHSTAVWIVTHSRLPATVSRRLLLASLTQARRKDLTEYNIYYETGHEGHVCGGSVTMKAAQTSVFLFLTRADKKRSNGMNAAATRSPWSPGTAAAPGVNICASVGEVTSVRRLQHTEINPIIHPTSSLMFSEHGEGWRFNTGAVSPLTRNKYVARRNTNHKLKVLQTYAQSCRSSGGFFPDLKLCGGGGQSSKRTRPTQVCAFIPKLPGSSRRYKAVKVELRSCWFSLWTLWTPPCPPLLSLRTPSDPLQEPPQSQPKSRPLIW